MSRCGSSTCNCLMIDPTNFFVDFDIPFNRLNHTIIQGNGSSSNPYFVENIFHQNFIPDAAKLRTTVAIPASTSMWIPFEIADINTAGMWVPYDNTKISIQRTGFYTFGASILWNTANPSFGNVEIGVYTGTAASPTSGFALAYQQSVQENNNTSQNQQTGQSLNFLSANFGSLLLTAGTVLRVGVISTVNFGATKASFWCCYV